MSLERHLTVQQASDELGIPKRDLYDAVERKQLRVVRRLGVGKNSRIRIPESAIVAWLETRTVHPDTETARPVPAVRSRPARPRVQMSNVMDLLPKGYKPRFSVQ
jgi:excisionase family DNA binding protein